MKIARVIDGDLSAWGVLEADEVALIGRWQRSDVQPDADAPWILSAEQLGGRLAASRERHSLKGTRLGAPLAPSSKVLCVGANYRDHAAEIAGEARQHPQIFLRSVDTLVGQGEALVRPLVSSLFDFEGELAVVIGEGGRHISAASALNHVFGYTCFMDGSVRDYQRHAISAGKNFWRSGAIGPWIVTADEMGEIQERRLQTLLNGTPVQSSRMGLMIHSVSELIAYCSSWTPLAPGDVIATGTPAGVGSRRSPALWMKAGDAIEVRIDGIGSLRNDVVDESPSSRTATP